MSTSASSRRRRLVAGTAVAAAAAAAVPFASAGAEEPSPTMAPPAAACEIDLLEVPHQSIRSSVAAGSPSGEYQVGTSIPSPDSMVQHSIVWRDGEKTQVRFPGSGNSLRDVNDSGDAVGTYIAGGAMQPAVYLDGQLEDLPGDDASAGHINQAGDAFGVRADHPDFVNSPVMWLAEDDYAEMIDLELPDDDAALSVHLNGIDEDGVMVGAYYTEDTRHPLIWDADGDVDYLPELDEYDKLQADGIRNGWIYGSELDSHTDDRTRLLWDATDGAPADPVEVDIDSIEDVTPDGQVVGSHDGLAAVLTDDGIAALPGLGGAEPDDRAVTASDDATQFAGRSVDEDAARAVIWTCD